MPSTSNRTCQGRSTNVLSMILLAPSLAYSTLFKNWDQRKKTEKSHYQNQINQHHNDKDTKTLQKYNDVQLSCLTCFDHDRLIHSITICSSENIHGDNNNIFFKISLVYRKPTALGTPFLSLVYRRKVRSSTRMVIWRALLGPECSAHLRLKSCLVLPS